MWSSIPFPFITPLKYNRVAITNGSLQGCSIGISPSRRSARTVPRCLHTRLLKRGLRLDRSIIVSIWSLCLSNCHLILIVNVLSLGSIWKTHRKKIYSVSAHPIWSSSIPECIRLLLSCLSVIFRGFLYNFFHQDIVLFIYYTAPTVRKRQHTLHMPLYIRKLNNKK